MSVDLHIHTTASDGSMTPVEIVKKADELKYTAISITDHDTVDGIPSAVREAAKLKMEIIPGIEINTDVEKGELHILGYFINYHDKKLVKELEILQSMRKKRARKMLDKLKEQNVHIEWDFLLQVAGSGTIGRAHIARALVEKGYASTWEEAFNRFIGKDSPAYVPRKRLTPEKAINLIKESGGIPVLAHPGLLKASNYIEDVISLGIMGIEVFYLEHSKEVIKKLVKIAEDNNLVMTGGSDDHGPDNKDGLRLGRVKLSYERVKLMKKIMKEYNKD